MSVEKENVWESLTEQKSFDEQMELLGEKIRRIGGLLSHYDRVLKAIIATQEYQGRRIDELSDELSDLCYSEFNGVNKLGDSIQALKDLIQSLENKVDDSQ